MPSTLAEPAGEVEAGPADAPETPSSEPETAQGEEEEPDGYGEDEPPPESDRRWETETLPFEFE